jgi:hypothetical protein
MRVMRTRLSKRLWRGCLAALLAMPALPVLASPEYQQWLAQQRLPLALSANPIDWSQPPTQIYSVDRGLSRPVLQDHDNLHERIETPVHVVAPSPYQPPVLTTPYRTAYLSYFNVTSAIHIPAAFDQYWSDKASVKRPPSGKERAVTQAVAYQLNTVRQHYQWSHWDLMRLVAKLSIDLQPEQSPAMMQWAILSALDLDVALGRQQNGWYLLFRSKQALVGLPSVTTARGRYYIDQGIGMAQDSALQVWQAESPTGSRLNLAPHPDAYYGSDWRQLYLGTGEARLGVPIEYARIQAVATVPLFNSQDYLALQWPGYLDRIMAAASGKTVKNEPNIATHEKLVRFVDAFFPDNEDRDVALLSVASGLPVPLNMSSLRTYILKRLLSLNGYQQMVVIASGDTLTLAIRAEIESDRTTQILGAPYELLNIGNRSVVVHIRQDTLGLTKDQVFGVY